LGGSLSAAVPPVEAPTTIILSALNASLVEFAEVNSMVIPPEINGDQK
jgi:hypothetical protein